MVDPSETAFIACVLLCKAPPSCHLRTMHTAYQNHQSERIGNGTSTPGPHAKYRNLPTVRDAPRHVRSGETSDFALCNSGKQ
jgi:hypothetical protein